jgi:PAS domain S-box-containing protein
MKEQIRSFTEALTPSNDDGDLNVEGRASELRVAIEELRAQNETLSEACARLEREMAKYRDLYDSAPEALVTTDARGVVIDANPAAARLLGLPRETLPGKLLIGFVARKDTGPFRDHLRAIAQSTGYGAFSVQIRPRGCSPVVAQLTVRTVDGSAVAASNGRHSRRVFHWTVRVEKTDEQLRPA